MEEMKMATLPKDKTTNLVSDLKNVLTKHGLSLCTDISFRKTGPQHDGDITSDDRRTIHSPSSSEITIIAEVLPENHSTD